MFSSLAALADFAGDTAWFSTTGRDVIDLLPAGHHLVLDPGQPYSIRLPSRRAADERSVTNSPGGRLASWTTDDPPQAPSVSAGRSKGRAIVDRTGSPS